MITIPTSSSSPTIARNATVLLVPIADFMLCVDCHVLNSLYCIRDCANVWHGVATLDDCLVCSGGTTNRTANHDKDCNGVCFGGYTWQNVTLTSDRSSSVSSTTFSSTSTCDNDIDAGCQNLQPQQPPPNTELLSSLSALFRFTSSAIGAMAPTPTPTPSTPDRRCMCNMSDPLADCPISGDLVFYSTNLQSDSYLPLEPLQVYQFLIGSAVVAVVVVLVGRMACVRWNGSDGGGYSLWESEGVGGAGAGAGAGVAAEMGEGDGDHADAAGGGDHYDIGGNRSGRPIHIVPPGLPSSSSSSSADAAAFFPSSSADAARRYPSLPSLPSLPPPLTDLPSLPQPPSHRTHSRSSSQRRRV